jgi:hypothetical protein
MHNALCCQVVREGRVLDRCVGCAYLPADAILGPADSTPATASSTPRKSLTLAMSERHVDDSGELRPLSAPLSPPLLLQLRRIVAGGGLVPGGEAADWRRAPRPPALRAIAVFRESRSLTALRDADAPRSAGLSVDTGAAALAGQRGHSSVPGSPKTPREQLVPGAEVKGDAAPLKSGCERPARQADAGVCAVLL